MRGSIERMLAVAEKEWRLNLRFPMDYIFNNAISPIKSAILMYCMYRGFLGKADSSLGFVNHNNFSLYIFVGITCHALFMSSLQTFRGRMMTEKYWQTITATLISPVSVFEMIFGTILGAVGVHIFMSFMILILVGVTFGISFIHIACSLALLLLLAVLGFGIGLIGTTLSLVSEGKVFVFDYTMQAVLFLSCFYYPAEVVPAFAHPIVKFLPTYQLGNMIQTLFLLGVQPNWPAVLSYSVVWTIGIVIVPALVLEHSVRKYGITGY